ncbi:formyltetrahydrofolate deformylase [Halorussus limi]|uniref:Formyltetrahydrofolate deformylase n=1 Tax=Halorussus limi TaxID=2938695 RepID=A0A8U0HVQ5_9EURY|nr:formyltetrahydrofolate deformylase [Halorussus limi]UPV75150.1 formyltetrahydrofolate deformylase [Halorussus limi]
MTRSELTEITVVGDDDTGLVARVTTLLFERGINIEDLDQAVRDDLFRMTMHVDATGMEGTREGLRADLDDLSDDLGVDVRVRFPDDRETKRMAVLVTKESHCLERLCEVAAEDELDAEISVVIGNHPDLQPVATEYGIPFHDIGDAEGNADEDRLLDLLGEYDIDLVVLARYMRILGPNVVFRYEGRIINVHPSLLPAFPGAKAYRQAKEAGVRIAGVTAHYVTTDLDQGPIVAQRAFNVPDGASVDTLKERGQPLEADVLLEAVRLHLADDVTVHRGRTELRDDAREVATGELGEADATEATGEAASGAAYQLGMPPELDRATPDEPTDERLVAPPKTGDD